MLRVGEDSPARYGSTQESEACRGYALFEAHAMEYDVGEGLVLRPIEISWLAEHCTHQPSESR